MTENTWPYHDHDDYQYENTPQTTDPAATGSTESQVPYQITQLSHLDPDGNASILEALNAASSSSSSASLNHDGQAFLAVVTWQSCPTTWLAVAPY